MASLCWPVELFPSPQWSCQNVSVIGYATQPVLIVATGLRFATRLRLGMIKRRITYKDLKIMLDYQLRNRHCQYVLPQCNFNGFKHSFVNWCLFTL